MKRDDILKTLETHKLALRQMGISHAALFGSYARQTEHPDSDSNSLIALDTEPHMNLFAYAGLKDHVTHLFDCSVDVIDRTALKKGLKGPVDKDAIYAF